MNKTGKIDDNMTDINNSEAVSSDNLSTVFIWEETGGDLKSDGATTVNYLDAVSPDNQSVDLMPEEFAITSNVNDEDHINETSLPPEQSDYAGQLKSYSVMSLRKMAR